MTSHRFYALIVTLLIASAAVGSSGEDEYWAFSELAPVKICDAVTSLRPGDRVPIVVYLVVYAMNLAFDPAEPCCPNGLDSVICLRYDREAKDQQNFEAYQRHLSLLHSDQITPLVATFEGILEAQPLPEDKEFYPEMPMKLRAVVNMTNRVRFRRCGGHAYSLLVYRIRSFEPASAEVLDSLNKPCDLPKAPMPVHLDLPAYPKHAQRLNYEGDVLVLVKVDHGEVVSSKLQVGDAVVAEEAVRNVRTWRFDESVTTEMVVRYRFRLEQRDAEREGLNPRYVLRLPYEVTVIAPWQME